MPNITGGVEGIPSPLRVCGETVTISLRLYLRNLLVFEPNRQTSVCQRAFWTVFDDGRIKNTAEMAVFFYPGGVEGIRTLDTVAGIPHFQCGALDQLCDDSGFFDDFNYSSSPASGVSSSSLSATIGSSINAFSNSASISRNSGSVDSTSNDCSAESVIGVSL